LRGSMLTAQKNLRPTQLMDLSFAESVEEEGAA